MKLVLRGMESRGDPARLCRRINRTCQLILHGKKRKIRHNGDPIMLCMGDQKKNSRGETGLEKKVISGCLGGSVR